MQWGAILRSVSAHRSYRWVYKENYRPWRIAEYLILNKAMPRSLRSSYDEINVALNDLDNLYGAKAGLPRHRGHRREASSPRATLTISSSPACMSSSRTSSSANNRLGSEVAEAYHFNG
ncbi:MAG: alpha-E domain-containing protein [Hyphomicrobium sp.]